MVIIRSELFPHAPIGLILEYLCREEALEQQPRPDRLSKTHPPTGGRVRTPRPAVAEGAPNSYGRTMLGVVKLTKVHVGNCTFVTWRREVTTRNAWLRASYSPVGSAAKTIPLVRPNPRRDGTSDPVWRWERFPTPCRSSKLRAL